MFILLRIKQKLGVLDIFNQLCCLFIAVSLQTKNSEALDVELLGYLFFVASFFVKSQNSGCDTSYFSHISDLLVHHEVQFSDFFSVT